MSVFLVSELALLWINIANLVLGFIAFALLFQRTWRRRNEYPREVLLLLVCLEAFVIALLATSTEMMFLASASVGGETLRLVGISFMIAVVKVGLLWALWTTRDALYRTGTRHVEGEGRNADEMDVNRDFADHPQEGM